MIVFLAVIATRFFTTLCGTWRFVGGRPSLLLLALVRRLLLDTHKQERTKDNGLVQGHGLFLYNLSR
jgi:hypothetical protein